VVPTASNLRIASTFPYPETDAATAADSLGVCHVMSADLWAGAEVQMASLASYLTTQPGVSLSVVLFNEGPLARRLESLGIDVEVIDERRHTALGILAFLVRFLSKRRVDIVHTHRYKDSILGTLAAKLVGVPHVIRTVHGLLEPMKGWDWFKACASNTADKLLLRVFGDRVIAVSHDLARTLRMSGYKAGSVISIHNGVDVNRVTSQRSRTDVRRELGIDPEAFVIGTAGRLMPVKAQRSLLVAAALLLRERPDARFLIVGDGPLRDALVETAEHLGIRDKCTLTGERSDVYDLVAAMDVFVLSSIHEGIPMALLEAMTIGRPIVATAVGGIREVITHGVNGLLVTPGDHQALAAACLEIGADAQLAGTLALRGQQTIAEKYSHEANGRSVLTTYHGLLAGERAASSGNRSTWRFCCDLLVSAAFCGRRKAHEFIETTIARYRMRRIRRRPARLLAAVRAARKILFVCQGNIIRSPYAASLLARELSGSAGLRIASAGLAAISGNAAHPTAMQLAGERRVDMSGHSASPLDAETVNGSDVIFVMEIPQLLALRQRFPQAESKTFLITCLAADVPLEVRDPYAGAAPEFNACFEHISRALGPVSRACSRAHAHV
jgi:L-malate glycosyltransferase